MGGQACGAGFLIRIAGGFSGLVNFCAGLFIERKMFELGVTLRLQIF